MKKVVIALGMFDGVHIGHLRLIEETVKRAAEENAIPAVYTFENHPLSFLGGQPKLLTDSETRKTILSTLGIRETWFDCFDASLASLSPEAFIKRLLSRYEIAETVVGFNYTFGAQAKGTAETLRCLGDRFGFRVTVLPPILHRGEAVSSSRIRRLLETEGDAERCTELLGRPYSLSETVIHGKHNGHRFGFPTANIEAPRDRVLPVVGVYATFVVSDGTIHPAITNVGTNPTVQGDHLVIESHLIGFDGDLYGKEIEVRFMHRLRSEKRFASEQELIDQIAADRSCTCKLLKIY